MKKAKLRQQRRRKCILLGWSLLGVIGLVWLCSLPIRLVAGLLADREVEGAGKEDLYTQQIWEQTKDTITNTVELGEENEEAENSANVGERMEEAALSKQCKALYEEYEELLVLVNREHPLEEGDYEDNLRSICNGRLQASEYLYEDLVDLLAAAGEEGHQYWIASAYRSRRRQQELVDEDVKRYMAQGMDYREALAETYKQTMPAGCSEHETGLALDLLCSENVNMDITQAEEPGNRWLTEHAHEYGFILRYPKEKEGITDISYEPWHFRYVGKEAATFLYEQGWTLEELHEKL